VFLGFDVRLWSARWSVRRLARMGRESHRRKDFRGWSIVPRSSSFEEEVWQDFAVESVEMNPADYLDELLRVVTALS
jgi:hypothetical protein